MKQIETYRKINGHPIGAEPSTPKEAEPQPSRFLPIQVTSGLERSFFLEVHTLDEETGRYRAVIVSELPLKPLLDANGQGLRVTVPRFLSIENIGRTVAELQKIQGSELAPRGYQFDLKLDAEKKTILVERVSLPTLDPERKIPSLVRLLQEYQKVK